MNEFTIVRAPLPVIDIRKGRKVWAVNQYIKVANYSEITIPNYSQANSSITQKVFPTDVISRTILYKQKVTFTATGTTSGPNMWQSGVLAPRPFPLTRSMANVNFNISRGAANSTPSNTFIFLQNFYYNYMDATVYNTLTPSTLDNCIDYADYYGSVRNVLSSVIDGTHLPPRGAFPIQTDGFVNTTTNLNVTWEFTEPLAVSPLTLKTGDSWNDPGLSRLTAFTIYITYAPNLIDRMLSYNPTNSTTTFATRQLTLGQPSILLGTYTLSMFDDIPPILQYPYNVLENVRQSYNSILAGTTANLFFNTTLQSIPKSVVLCVTDGDIDNKTWDQPDWYLEIRRVTVLTSAANNQFSATAPQQLFLLNCKNGQSFHTYGDTGWSDGDIAFPFLNANTNTLIKPVGQPLRLKFGEDITLPFEYLAPSVEFSGVITFNLTVYNQSANTVTVPTLNTIFIYDGVATITSAGDANFNQNVLRKDDVLNAMANPVDIEWSMVQPSSYGGNFFGSIKKAFKKTGKALKGANKLIDRGIDVTTAIDPEVGNRLAAAKRGLTGGRRAGGASMSRTQLKNNLY